MHCVQILVSPLPGITAGALFRWNDDTTMFEHRTPAGRVTAYTPDEVKSGFHFSPYFPTLPSLGVDTFERWDAQASPLPPCRHMGVMVPASWPPECANALQLTVHEAMTKLAAQYSQPTPEQINFANPH